MKEDYFLTSGDKIRFFWEAEASDENGILNRPKHKALNKIGHGRRGNTYSIFIFYVTFYFAALHFLNPEFKEATFSPKLEVMLRKLGFKKPAIPQSMYIFKVA